MHAYATKASSTPLPDSRPLYQLIARTRLLLRSSWVATGLGLTLGLLTGTVGYAPALGGIFALVFAAAYGRIGKASPRTTAAVLAPSCNGDAGGGVGVAWWVDAAGPGTTAGAGPAQATIRTRP